MSLLFLQDFFLDKSFISKDYQEGPTKVDALEDLEDENMMHAMGD